MEKIYQINSPALMCLVLCESFKFYGLNMHFVLLLFLLEIIFVSSTVFLSKICMKKKYRRI